MTLLWQNDGQQNGLISRMLFRIAKNYDKVTFLGLTGDDHRRIQGGAEAPPTFF